MLKVTLTKPAIVPSRQSILKSKKAPDNCHKYMKEGLTIGTRKIIAIYIYLYNIKMIEKKYKWYK